MTPDQIVDQVMELPEGHPVPGLRPRRLRARASTASCSTSSRGRASHVPASTARCGSSASRSGWPRRTSTSRSSSTGSGAKLDIRRRRRLPSRPRPAARRGHRIDRGPDARRGRAAELLPIAGVHALRTLVRRDGPEELLVQLPVRRVSDPRRPRHAARGRPRARRARYRSLRARRRARALGERNVEVRTGCSSSCRRSPRHRPRHTVPPAREEAARRAALRQRRADPRAVQEPVRTAAFYHHVRGRGHQRRAASPRDRLRVPARQTRAVHARDPVPGARVRARDPKPSRSPSPA